MTIINKLIKLSIKIASDLKNAEKTQQLLKSLGVQQRKINEYAKRIKDPYQINKTKQNMKSLKKQMDMQTQLFTAQKEKEEKSVQKITEQIKAQNKEYKERTSSINEWGKLIEKGVEQLEKQEKAYKKMGVAVIAEEVNRKKVIKESIEQTKAQLKRAKEIKMWNRNAAVKTEIQIKKLTAQKETHENIINIFSKKREKSQEKLKLKEETQQKLLGKKGSRLKALKKAWLALGVAAVGAITWMIATSPQLSGQMKIMKLHTDRLGRTMGKHLAPMFKWITSLIKGMVDWYINLSEPMQKLIVVIIAVVAGLTLLVGVIIAITVVVGILQTVGAPIILIIIAVIIVITAIIMLIIYWDEVMQWLAKTWQDFMEFLSTVGDVFVLLGEAIWALLKLIGKAIGDFFVMIGTAIGGFFSGMWDDLKEGWDIFVVSVETLFTTFWTNLKSGFTDFVDTIKDFFASIGDLFSEEGTISIAFEIAWKTVLNGVVGFINTLIEGINVFLQVIADALIWLKVLDEGTTWAITLIPEFAKGALTIPETMYAKVHEGEMIVPARQAQAIRQGDMALGQFGGRASPTGAGNVTMSPSFTFNIYEARDINKLKREVSDHILKEMQRMRNRK